MKKSALWVIAVTVLCCATMAVVDGVIRPVYTVKSVIKLILFLGLPLLVSLLRQDIVCRELLRFQKKGALVALGLGVGIYAVILLAYHIVKPYFDFSSIAGNLSQNAGVTRDNFLAVSLYISFVNSLLEEFFFRGFVFTNLKRSTGRTFAHLFSAGCFAVYHVAMMTGWFSPVLFVLVMVGLTAGGLIFNFLNERLNTIYGSWLAHMFANFAINTIGFLLLQ